MNSILDDIKIAFNQRDNAVKQLILINVLVFVTLILLRFIFWLAQINFLPWVVSYLAMPSDFFIFIRRPWTMFTYFFTHEGLFHIFFNMLNLYWFGMLIREYLGSKKVISLYILGGLAGALLYILCYSFIPSFQNLVRGSSAEMIGASASVCAIVVAAATLLPNYSFHLLLIGSVKIKYIALFVVIMSIAGISGGNPGGNVAHIGGSILGFLFIKQLQRGNDWGRPIHGFWEFVSGLFKSRPKMKVTYTNSTSANSRTHQPNSYGKPSQVEIDIILDKISKSGYESLSKEEKQKLFQFSQKD